MRYVVNADKRKVIVLGGKKGLESVKVQLFRVLQSGSNVAGDIRPLVNDRGLQLECVKVLQEALLVLVLLYGRDNDMERSGGLDLG